MTQATRTTTASGGSVHHGPPRAIAIPLAIGAFLAATLGALVSALLISSPLTYETTDLMYWPGRTVDTMPAAIIAAVAGVVLGVITIRVFNAGRALLRAD